MFVEQTKNILRALLHFQRAVLYVHGNHKSALQTSCPILHPQLV